MSTFLPSEFLPGENLLNSQQVLQMFTALPDVTQKQTNSQWYEITDRVDHDDVGTIEFTLAVKDINNATGDYITYFSDDYRFHFTLSGFKKTE